MTTKPSNHPFAKLQALRTTEPAKSPGEGSPGQSSSTGRPLAPGVSTRPPPPPPKQAPPREDPASAIKQPPPKPIASSAPSPTSAVVSSHPFAKLQALRTAAPSGGAPAGAAAAAGAGPDGKGPAWAVIRLERKGRGGKEATIVEKLGLPPAELEQWCKDLKQTLGCGGVVEGDTIILQGDLRPRLSAVLAKRGVRKVTVG